MNKQFFMTTLLVSSMVSTQVLASVKAQVREFMNPTTVTVRVDAVVRADDCVRDERGNLIDCTKALMDYLTTHSVNAHVSYDVPLNIAAFTALQVEALKKENALQVEALRKENLDNKVAANRRENALKAALTRESGLRKEVLEELDREIKKDEENTRLMEVQSKKLEQTAEKAHEGAKVTKEKFNTLRQEAKETTEQVHIVLEK